MRAKIQEQEEARKLRAAGVPFKRVAKQLGVSPGSVHKWCSDIVLTETQKAEIKRAKNANQEITRTCTNCGEHFGRTAVEDGKKRRISSDRTECSKCKPLQMLPTGTLSPPQRVVRSRRKRKRIAVEHMGGSCQACGYNRCIGALHFHHIDPNEKDFSIGQKNYLGWEKVRKELKKCVMLCANCHAEVHAGILDLNISGVSQQGASLTKVARKL